MDSESKLHWEKIYSQKTDEEVSWYQEVPQTSLRLIEELSTKKTESIIDIGGGNSNLTHELLKNGFNNLSVLDISGRSIDRMKRKLGNKSTEISWIESDILELKDLTKYKIWHDRAVFHFLTDQRTIFTYKSRLLEMLQKHGYFILSTFSCSGPKKCSGLDISQYDEKSLITIFSDSFELLDLFHEDHTTPSGSIQNFITSVWKKK